MRQLLPFPIGGEKFLHADSGVRPVNSCQAQRAQRRAQRGQLRFCFPLPYPAKTLAMLTPLIRFNSIVLPINRGLSAIVLVLSNYYVHRLNANLKAAPISSAELLAASTT